MNRMIRGTCSAAAVLAATLLLAAPMPLDAQARGAGAQGAGASARANAPIDPTGYWVSVVTEDWFWRMMTPAKGDVASVPLNAEGRTIAESWDPARNEAAGEECKAYGAPAIMRLPGRFHITWEDDNTLLIETDNGMQTRRLHFRGSAPSPAEEERSRQGISRAEWELAGPGGRRAGPPQQRGGSLKVVTTNLRPGYLRKNGVPYSEDTVVTEYFTLMPETFGERYMVVTTTVTDPQYLNEPFITSTHLKKQPDDRGWNPTPCSAR